MGLTQAQKTLIGIMIIKFATGFTADWGILSLYVLSYYHFHKAPVQINASTNSLIMILLVIPVTICLVIAAKVASCLGYVRSIRIFAWVFLLTPLFSFFNFHFITFMLCNLILPCSAFSLAIVPMFHCMYSHYGQSKSLATGAVICSFGIGAIVWNLIATLWINPDNVVPDIQTPDPNLNFFPLQIADRVQRAFNIIYAISGILFVIGSYLITSNQNYKDETANAVDINIQPQVNQPGHYSQIAEQNIQYKQTRNLDEVPTAQLQKEINIWPYVKHPISMLLFIMNITGCVYQVYVQLYTKLIYMPFLQDDHLISIGIIVIILSSAIFGILWGLLADKKGPPCAVIVFVIVDLAGKIFASVVMSRVGFIFSMIFLGGTDKTMLILFAPTLIDCFGLRVTSQLLPFKGLSGILSVILAAALGFIFAKIPPQYSLYCLCSFSIINIGLGVCLANIVRQQQLKRLQAKKQKI